MSALPETATASIKVSAVPSAAQESAARGGAQLLAAAVVALVCNYLFLLGAGRLLGSADYGTVAALAGLLTVVLLPTGAIQMAISREVSRHEALGEQAEAAAFVRGLVVLGAKATVPLMVVALALLVPMRELLRIDATEPVALAMTALIGVFLFPISLGSLQGQQRFRALAFNSAAPMVIRLAFFAALVVGGLRLYGALGALAVSSVAGTTMALIANRSVLRSARGITVPNLRPFLRYLVPVAVGLFGIAVLTNADILIVKARFSAEDAGVYAAASAFARVAFFLPSTILAIVFPRTAARQARGEQSADILGRSLIVTAAFCALLTGAYALVGARLVDVTFGDEFASAAELLVPFCVAMTCFSLANVALGYHLSRSESRFAWIVAASIPVQLAVLATVPDTLRGVLWVDALLGIGLLLAHELSVGSSAGAIRTGFQALAASDGMRSASAWLSARWTVAIEIGIVLCGYALLAVVVTWPLALHLGSALPGTFPNDGTGGAAWFWELQREGGFRLLGTTHHTLTGAPFGWDQGNALNFQWLLPYYPGYLLIGVVGEVAAINLVTLSGLALSGGAMYLLVRWLGCPKLVAAWAGAVYLAFPWHLERAMAGHSSLVHLEMFPLFLLAALAWVRRPTDGRAALVALVTTGAWLTSGYYGAMIIVALAGVTVVAVPLIRRELGWARSLGRTAKLWAMVVLASGVVGLTSALAGGTAAIGTGRGAAELTYWGARLHDYLPDPANRLVGGVSDHVGSALFPYIPGAEKVLYPGLLTVALAFLWVGLVLKRRVSTQLRTSSYVMLVMVAVGVVFATPDPIRLGGLTIHPTPSFLLYEVLPRVRVPSRLIVITMVGLVPLAALGLAWFVAYMSRRVSSQRARIAAVAIPIVAGVISVAELAPIPIVTSNVSAVPPQYRVVQSAGPGILAEYPMTATWAYANLEYVFWQRVHKRRLLNGAAEFTQADDIREMLVDPAAPGTAGALRLLGVTTIVTRPTTLDWHEAQTRGDRRSYGPGYRLLSRAPGGVRVWEVVAPAAPAVVSYRRPDVAGVGRQSPVRFTPYPVSGSVVHLDLYARRAQVARLGFDTRLGGNAPVIRIDGQGSSTVVHVGGNGRVSFPVHIPRGHSLLTLSFTPRSRAHTRRPKLALSAPRWSPSVPADVAGAIHPTLISSDPGL